MPRPSHTNCQINVGVCSVSLITSAGDTLQLTVTGDAFNSAQRRDRLGRPGRIGVRRPLNKLTALLNADDDFVQLAHDITPPTTIRRSDVVRVVPGPVEPHWIKCEGAPRVQFYWVNFANKWSPMPDGDVEDSTKVELVMLSAPKRWWHKWRKSTQAEPATPAPVVTAPPSLTDNQRLRILCTKLLDDLRFRLRDPADSNLPEWEREALALGVEPTLKHDHTCHCGTATVSPHELGHDGCCRRLVPAPIFVARAPSADPNFTGDPNYNRWQIPGELGGSITEFTLRQQRGYYQHPCGCWSASPESSNSIEA